jgi:ABC-type sulfate transport system substrate-binding protein
MNSSCTLWLQAVKEFIMKKSVLSAVGLFTALTLQTVSAADVKLLNVSYDPTRYIKTTMIEGLDADVITLAPRSQ